jgi:hypothetical protein
VFADDDTAGETAISYTDQFFDAAVKKIDKKFGAGFAKEHPTLVQAYVSTCASNLHSFMTSVMALQSLGGLTPDDLSEPR